MESKNDLTHDTESKEEKLDNSNSYSLGQIPVSYKAVPTPDPTVLLQQLQQTVPNHSTV
jgi:hypothetical protein